MHFGYCVVVSLKAERDFRGQVWLLQCLHADPRHTEILLHTSTTTKDYLHHYHSNPRNAHLRKHLCPTNVHAYASLHSYQCLLTSHMLHVLSCAQSMFKGCIQVSMLVVAALLVTMAAPSVANQIEWLCERGEDGAPRAEIVNFGDQWFQINVEQDGCKRSCEQQIKSWGLSPDEESKEIQAFAGTVPTLNFALFLSQLLSLLGTFCTSKGVSV